jgi:hypothetical protein
VGIKAAPKMAKVKKHDIVIKAAHNLPMYVAHGFASEIDETKSHVTLNGLCQETQALQEANEVC